MNGDSMQGADVAPLEQAKAILRIRPGRGTEQS
jgi:hypothetical protein